MVTYCQDFRRLLRQSACRILGTRHNAKAKAAARDGHGRCTPHHQHKMSRYALRQTLLATCGVACGDEMWESHNVYCAVVQVAAEKDGDGSAAGRVGRTAT